RGQLGERALLVIAPLRETVDRLLAQDVHTGVHPLVEDRRLTEPGDPAVLLQVDDAERRAHLRDDDRPRRRRARVFVEQRPEVDVEELVAVQREAGAVLPPPRRGEAKTRAAPARLLLPHRAD